MDLRSRRETYNGFGMAMSRGVELAVTPAIFGFLGHLLDRTTGTSPVFLLVAVLFAVTGMFVRAWIGYDAEMRRHEAGAPWQR